MEFYLLSLACLVMVATAQQFCPPTNILFLFDQSENAKKAATDSATEFNILQTAVRSFLNHPYIQARASDIRVEGYGYMASTPPVTIFEQNTTVSQALNKISLIGSGGSGGSWTYRGLEQVEAAPQYANNLMIVISSQGSGSSSRRNLAGSEINRINAQLGWKSYVIALQGANPIDLDELTLVNGGRRPVILDDKKAADPKSYTLLDEEFKNIIENILCTEMLATTTTKRPAVTIAPTARPSGLCSQCLFEGGYGFDFDADDCEAFYQCVKDSEPIKKYCPAGTFFDGTKCNFMNDVDCPSAVCNKDTPKGTRYASSRCCNLYHECNDGVLTTNACKVGEIFSASTSMCTLVSDTSVMCEGAGRYECDVDRNGPTGVTKCDGYGPDPFGNPCFFQYSGWRLPTARGTVWNQTICSLDFTTVDYCTLTNEEDKFFGEERSDVCNAVFLANFNGGSRAVFSERMQKELEVYSILQEAEMMNDAVMFDSSMSNPFLYYYYFNNRVIEQNTAIRVRARIDTTDYNKEYDILSNNYCSQCPATISLTVSPTSATNRVVSVTLSLSDNTVVTTSAIIDKSNANEWLDIIVIFGEGEVYGQVSSLSGTTVSKTVEFNKIAKAPGVTVLVNRCGFVLGKGPNMNFVGAIDEFAVYEYCQDISSIMNM